mgnify:CR=1 FL=1
MIRILCLLAFVFANFPPAYANGSHEHGEKNGHKTPPPTTAPTDNGGIGNSRDHRLRNALLAAGLVYVAYSWGGKKSDNGVKFGVRVQEAP